MTTAREIITELQKMFPAELRAKWDTTDGLVSGNTSKTVQKVILGLELRDTISHKDADMFIVHHPPIFGPEKKVTNPSYKKAEFGSKIVYAIHSRLDITGFVSKAIAEKLFKKDKYHISKILEDGTVIIELKKPLAMKEIIHAIKDELKLKSVNAITTRASVRRIGIHGGEAFAQHHVDDAVKEKYLFSSRRELSCTVLCLSV